MNQKFAFAILLNAAAFLVQNYFGWVGIGLENAILITLISSAFICSSVELIFLIFTAVWLLNWQPAPSFELIALAVIPLAVHYLWKIFPGSLITAYFGTLVLGITIWYLAVDIQLVTQFAFLIAREVLFGVIIGMLLLTSVIRYEKA